MPRTDTCKCKHNRVPLAAACIFHMKLTCCKSLVLLVAARMYIVCVLFSGTPIAQADLTKKYLPMWFSSVATLSDCSHDGRYYHDVDHDFILEIPEGAIPKGESITIDIGVALQGPFQYPEDLRPVSPVFWVCVREQKNFQFLKPIKVTIPHFLHLENLSDIDSLGLTFLKGDHEMNSQQMYPFRQAEGDILFKPFGKYGVLQTTHLCSQCVGSKDMESLKTATFCLTSVLPNEISFRQPSYAYFFITFMQPTCLTKLKEQINKVLDIQGHKKAIRTFEFIQQEDPSLEIVLPSMPSNSWMIGPQLCEKVCSNFV